MLGCTLAAPGDFFLWLQCQWIGSLVPAGSESGHMRGLAVVQSRAQICAQSELQSS